ncbi:uncharacterized protein [Apostichopus japonicus]|uniref:uncharacterized protein isoform X2 n=1 Tax=Stichopus japonicus TaxID=307972 RepID=UPI003AB1EE57
MSFVFLSYKELRIVTADGKMKIYCIFMIFACVLPKCSAYHISDSEAGRTTASTLVKEGLPAEIFCMVEGTGDYFWRKGESFDKSTLVASFTGDNANKDNEPYVVRVNGTLFIRNVTLKDEGKYFCRVTSVENECHGEVKVFVQASLRNFVLDIDACDNESSCLSYISPSQSISLTCTAYNAPPLMTLKWFNGSKEITEGIQQNEILPLNGNSRYITSTVTAVYGHPAILTCQAVDPKRSNDDVRFVHAQVKMTVPFIETLPIWLFVAVTSAGCFIVFGIILLIKAMANRKRRKNNKTRKGENVELLANQEKKDGEISELKELAKTKDQEIANKDEELTKLKRDVQSKAKSIADLEKTVKQKDKEIKNQLDKFLDCQSKLKAKDSELEKISKVYANLKALLEKERELNRAKEQKSSGRSSNNK